MGKYIALSIIGILVILIVAFFFLGSHDSKIKLITPLPDFLTKFKNQQTSTLNLWLPNLDTKVDVKEKLPETTAVSALTYDLSANKLIFVRNPKTRLPIASLTKIMTAIIALGNKKTDNQYLVRKKDLVGEDSMGIEDGEIFSQEELLYGLILNSGNDAAEVFAHNYSGGRENFILSMNEKARSLGLKDTNFTNPSGLEGDGNQYSTAYDILVITAYALNNFPLFREVAATYEHYIPKTSNHKEYTLYNETNLITSYPGVKGVKTGYTSEAGMCLVTYLDYDGHKIIGVILNSEDRRQEMMNLLDYSLKSLDTTPPHHN